MAGGQLKAARVISPGRWIDSPPGRGAFMTHRAAILLPLLLPNSLAQDRTEQYEPQPPLRLRRENVDHVECESTGRYGHYRIRDPADVF